jgi:hypothetical protein
MNPKLASSRLSGKALGDFQTLNSKLDDSGQVLTGGPIAFPFLPMEKPLFILRGFLKLHQGAQESMFPLIILQGEGGNLFPFHTWP